MAEVILKNVSKSFGRVEVIHGVDLHLRDKAFTVFVGPSGCGKSTLLRLIAGLEDISSGDLLFDGRRVNELTPKERGISMVFQSYALYPHMTVYQNMAFGLKLAKAEQGTIDQRVRRAAGILELGELLDRLPKHLSGGQRQRVAIGRAIVREPQVFLFDEPLSNLDAALRVQMRIEIAKLHENLGVTMVYVTHDQVEAMTLADTIVVLSDGNVEQVGAPLDLYHHPQNRFVAGFIGSPQMNFIDGEVVSADAGGVKIAIAGGVTVVARVAGGGVNAGDALTLGVRPEHLREIEAGAAAPTAGDAVLDGAVEVLEQLGESHFLHVRTDTGIITLRAGGDTPLHEHAKIGIEISGAHCHLFRPDGTALQRAPAGASA
ncbi:ABC transporter ATP-binding protein [Varunaivibrio sulfuroxidans]|uniref:Multiple sugar transport system ATP-binding protein n=1 Tax=Varunaivibrio sulfuroxidans TaxID=1773489 RepID=A0A4R3JB09_9PROT|nr:sn-glycerol-3-phosphate ABC transporter ATP-binding protein UgpC [Varunaivibrio sulfuroxidans]TCS62223.1 multiple sugar transport system ATP-binding protein [Varunaivibrio sulfuroxidans]WES30648.1 sn-glycerol-3-phosphate ABC transporter ATP-binding protein UgpC [Varunaivibrio sulfuroxidans]